jgi:hypothetical protein
MYQPRYRFAFCAVLGDRHSIEIWGRFSAEATPVARRPRSSFRPRYARSEVLGARASRPRKEMGGRDARAPGGGRNDDRGRRAQSQGLGPERVPHASALGLRPLPRGPSPRPAPAAGCRCPNAKLSSGKPIWQGSATGPLQNLFKTSGKSISRTNWRFLDQRLPV